VKVDPIAKIIYSPHLFMEVEDLKTEKVKIVPTKIKNFTEIVLLIIAPRFEWIKSNRIPDCEKLKALCRNGDSFTHKLPNKDDPNEEVMSFWMHNPTPSDVYRKHFYNPMTHNERINM